MAVDVTTDIVIDRPAAVVAAYAADPTNAPAWYANIESIEWQTDPPMTVGSKMDFVAHFLGRRLAYTYEILDYIPGERLVMRTAQGPFPDDLHMAACRSRAGQDDVTQPGRTLRVLPTSRPIHGGCDAASEPQGPSRSQGDPRGAMRAATSRIQYTWTRRTFVPDPGPYPLASRVSLWVVSAFRSGLRAHIR